MPVSQLAIWSAAAGAIALVVVLGVFDYATSRRVAALHGAMYNTGALAFLLAMSGLAAELLPASSARALHVVGETARTRFGAQLLTRGRLRRFGELLYEAHESCRRLYECSAPELDLVVAAARRAGALGARLTGAGWGGAVLVLLGKGDGRRGKGEAKVAKEIRRVFMAAYGREPSITRVRPSSGARGKAVTERGARL